MLLLPLFACRCAGPDTGDSGDTDTVDPIEESAGMLVVGRLAETRSYDAQTIVHGVFSPDAEWLEPLDPLGAMADDGYDVYFVNDWFALPAQGEEALDDGVSWQVAHLSTWDAGERILLGDDLVGYAEAYGDTLVYIEDDAERLPESVFAAGGSLSLTLEGGVDLGAQTVTGIVAAEPIELLDADPFVIDVVRPDEAIGVSWTPSTHEDALMVVHAEGGTYGVVRVLPDGEGTVVFSPEELAELDGEAVTITLSRIIDTPVQLDEGVLTVRTLQETFVSWQQVESLGFHPEAGLIGERQVIEVYDVEGRLEGDVTLDLGEGIVTELIDVEPGGEVARFDVLIGDDAPSGGHTVVLHTETGDIIANQPLYLYIPLPHNDVCLSSQTGPALAEDELYFSDGLGLTNEHSDTVSCNGANITYEGRDQFHRMHLEAGEVLRASAFSLYGDVAMLVYDDCGGNLLVCEDYTTDNEIELMEWTVPETGTYYMVLDNYYDIESDQLYVTWDAAPPADLLAYDHVIPGQTETLIVNTQTVAFDSGIGFDLGDGISVNAITLVSESHVELDIEVALDAVPGTREMVATQGADTFTGPLEVDGLLPLNDDCADAAAFGPLSTANWLGTLEGSTNSGFDNSTWSTGEFFGDAIFEVDLPNEGTSFHANVLSQQDVTLSLHRACEEGSLPVRYRDAVGVYDVEFLDFVVGAGEAGTFYLVVSATGVDVGMPFQMYVQVLP